MPIDFSCASCGQQYRVKEEFAGKSTKCRKCGSKVTVPQPAAELEPLGGLDSLLDEELGAAGSPQPAAAAEPAEKLCPSCNSPLPIGGRLCLQCGYDLTTGKSRTAPSADADAEPKSESGLMGPLLLLRGTAVSALGAILGAVVWAIVAVMTGLEIGWIAIGVGAAAGGGMAAGYDDKRDGTIPGIIAAFMALGGIVLGKIFIVIWVLMPLVTGNLEDFRFKREMIASNMATEALQKRGVDAGKVGAAAWEKEYDKEFETAMASLENLGDEEIDRRMVELQAKMEREIELAGQQQQQPADKVAVAAQAPGQQPDAADVVEPEEDGPSLVGLFFAAMFSPIDGLFILLAFFTAYKLGSGVTTD
jgi:DNA-directed RNA polymerase subunit RPC12/RpoP